MKTNTPWVATSGLGGGISAGGPVIMNNSSVTSNAGNSGGGIVTDNLQMDQSHIDSNISTGEGGGIWSCCSIATFTAVDRH